MKSTTGEDREEYSAATQQREGGAKALKAPLGAGQEKDTREPYNGTLQRKAACPLLN
ncbi:MAG: hypothetical protein ACLTEJ_14400 [Neglectibacter timonensis]|uniref:hypothetical protein n=1 Tax=Neglectibacter timonensis TaxID=1776382 RepID=UPI00399255BB